MAQQTPTWVAESPLERLAAVVAWGYRLVCRPAVLEAGLSLLLFLGTIALRRPYKMLLPYAWDSVLFVRAVDSFNATIHQPQPPGYLFYVSAARLLDRLAPNPERALAWVSMLAAGVAVVALYLLARLLFDRATGVIAAGFLATSVTSWFYSEIAYPYTTLAAGSTLLALLALALRRGLLPGSLGAAAAAFAFGLLTGFRQDLILFLSPLFIAGLWGRPLRHWLAGFGAGAAGVLLWLIPTAGLSEGLGTYLDATLRQGGMASGDSSVVARGLQGLLANGEALAIFLWHGLSFALPPLLYGLARWLLPSLARVRRGVDPAAGWLLLWVAPPLLFYLLAHIGDHGYTFSLLPALCLLAAVGLRRFATDLIGLLYWLYRRVAGRSGRAVLAVQPLASVTLALLLALALVGGNRDRFIDGNSHWSVRGIKCFDWTMQERLRLVRQHFPVATTMIFSSAYYQHVRYYLPEYQVWFHEPLDGANSSYIVKPGTRFLIMFDELAQPVPGRGRFDTFTLPCNGVPFHYANVRGGDVALYDGQTLSMQVVHSFRRGPAPLTRR